ncbi:hypothetical protein [Nocardia cyriacigeorgica]|uniref:hypothetical protein n=1 Tax=Nocardia cyriacigeorgica TaxID=135487 RepID=UPI00189600C2|nr:hypothetical protein [Nocardia cyriacigeorgica]MBF6411633.1 hypothetical protein [Nocardia cyriacigeorgica]
MGSSDLYEQLRALEVRARKATEAAGKKYSRREVAKAISKRGRNQDGLAGFDGQRISDWVPTGTAKPKCPTDGPQFWALVGLWSEWAGEPLTGAHRRMWADLLEAAQPARLPVQPSAGRGEPIADADPFAYQIHRPIELRGRAVNLPVLPRYARRAHDKCLQAVVDESIAGKSRIVCLVGESSTGKSRALWEAVGRLPSSWRIWNPFDPSPVESLLSAVSLVTPRTVVWLNDIHLSLSASDELGERAAAALRTLIYDNTRAPVLILSTAWPDDWRELTEERSSSLPDVNAQRRQLLTGCDIHVPSSFGQEDLIEFRRQADIDPRLAEAIEFSKDGQLIQYIAGGPSLIDRYYNAPIGAKSLIKAAMDARRFGFTASLSKDFLVTAAASYFTDVECSFESNKEDWFDEALRYATRPCKGVPGPLVEVRPRPVPGLIGSNSSSTTYKLSDYLDQVGRRLLCATVPPSGFWDAVVSYSNPASLISIVRTVRKMGLADIAYSILMDAAARGSESAAVEMLSTATLVHIEDKSQVIDWIARHGNFTSAASVAVALNSMRKLGADHAILTLVERGLISSARLDGAESIGILINALLKLRRRNDVSTIVDRISIDELHLRNPRHVITLVSALRRADATEHVHAIVQGGYLDKLSLIPSSAIAELIEKLHFVSMGHGRILARRVLAQPSGMDARGASALLHTFHRCNYRDEADVLASLVVEKIGLASSARECKLIIKALKTAGYGVHARDFSIREASSVDIKNPALVAIYLGELRTVKASDAMHVILERQLECSVSLVNLGAVARLLAVLRSIGQISSYEALADRAATNADLANAGGVASLLNVLSRRDSRIALESLISRDPGRVAALVDPREVKALIVAFRRKRATTQISYLVNRGLADSVTLDDAQAVDILFHELRRVGARDAAARLDERRCVARRRFRS